MLTHSCTWLRWTYGSVELAIFGASSQPFAIRDVLDVPQDAQSCFCFSRYRERMSSACAVRARCLGTDNFFVVQDYSGSA